MARTKQTARRSTGGIAPRMPLGLRAGSGLGGKERKRLWAQQEKLQFAHLKLATIMLRRPRAAQSLAPRLSAISEDSNLILA
ncbi:hypothetical protein GMDG_08684 [Pseudogymnoascus destructans 20631-21]|uniref:Uncharacterized protein n=1 Tax=Pseudogymnoascus destructans (strain ATCC MYA-4855 / 20631-21) TaxID=658429 RepID=L8G9F1_PSED2|nr:hypothetical protein, variant [Pseudogymnoascus destructans 20631-21]ELR09279.1 hypothetical protein GMDG_08684 [Pseudogymnoascus destructans 20631-21]